MIEPPGKLECVCVSQERKYNKQIDLTWLDLTWPDLTWPDPGWCNKKMNNCLYWTEASKMNSSKQITDERSKIFLN